MHARFIPIACAALLATAAAPAAADPAVETDLKTELRGELGFSSPIGVAGFTVTRDLSDLFRIEGGAGFGGTGLQLSLMPRMAFGGGEARFLIGAGPSVSSWGKANMVLWMNAEPVGISVRFADGLNEGITAFAAGGLAVCVAGSSSGNLFSRAVESGDVFPQLRAGIGYAF